MEQCVITVTLNPALDKTVTVDNFEIGGLNRVKEMRIDPGGKGINVAKVLNKFGVNVQTTGLIAGKQGDLLLQRLSGFHPAGRDIPGRWWRLQSTLI